jgi:hypothetical protein
VEEVVSHEPNHRAINGILSHRAEKVPVVNLRGATQGVLSGEKGLLECDNNSLEKPRTAARRAPAVKSSSAYLPKVIQLLGQSAVRSHLE